MGLHAHNRDPNLLRYIKVVPFFRTARYMIYLNNIKSSSGIGKVARPEAGQSLFDQRKHTR